MIIVQKYKDENFGLPASNTQFILKLSSSHPHVVVHILFHIVLQMEEQSGGAVEWLFYVAACWQPKQPNQVGSLEFQC